GFSAWVQLGAKGAGIITGAITNSTGVAMFATVKDNLQMKVVPIFDREKPFEILFGLGNIFTRSQSPALGKAMNMGIERKGRNPKSLRPYHLSRFMAYAWKEFQGYQIGRDRSVELFAQDL